MKTATWGPLMPFFDKSDAFTEGFECGQIWERIKNGETFVGQPIHVKNIPQIELICEMYGVTPEIEIYCDTWACMTVHPLIIE